jgi:hypothetical protein
MNAEDFALSVVGILNYVYNLKFTFSFLASLGQGIPCLLLNLKIHYCNRFTYSELLRHVDWYIVTDVS